MLPLKKDNDKNKFSKELRQYIYKKHRLVKTSAS